uniref:Craniofacial development protein 2-like n=1 Tax=Nicotiana tabacum TaxID=4097 RepID=A0A1S4BAK3_TOBAC|nr:PREDICTED: craniofacial development protein 2-like [Nicotiana tabacum]
MMKTSKQCRLEFKWELDQGKNHVLTGSRARDVDGYKLWYSEVQRGKNGVGILVDGELRKSVVEVRRVNDRLMTIKLVVGECTLNIVSAYAPHTGLDEEVKRRFWEGLDEIVRQVPPTERLFIEGNFNGKVFGLVIANSSFSKREEHLVTFQNKVAKT